MVKAQDWKVSRIPTKWTVTRDKTATAERHSNATEEEEEI
jgi:hypothetical protein